MLVTNNLYGLAMSQKLPIGQIKWAKKIPDKEWNENDDFAYILEVDLEYPNHLHDEHCDYPLAPENIHVMENMLSEHQRDLHFTTVLDVRRARSDERVARGPKEFAFHHSFGRPTITFYVKGCFSDVKICISPQFRASDDHFLR